MAVVALKSDVMTKLETAPVPLMVSSKNVAGVILGATAWASKAAGDNATSTYRMLRVHSSWRLRTMILSIGALGALGTVNVGVYQTIANGGAVVSAITFGSAIDVSATYRSDIVATGANADDMAEQLWQRLGLSEDSNRYYDLVIELQHAGAGNAVKLGLDISYQK